MAVCFSHSVMSNSVTSWTAAHQASPSVGFSRQQYWSGLPFPSPLMVVVRINLFHHIRRENFYLQFFLNLNKSFYFSILNTIKRLEIAFEDLSLIWKHLICLFIYMYMTVWILVIKKKKWAILSLSSSFHGAKTSVGLVTSTLLVWHLVRGRKQVGGSVAWHESTMLWPDVWWLRVSSLESRVSVLKSQLSYFPVYNMSKLLTMFQLQCPYL